MVGQATDYLFARCEQFRRVDLVSGNSIQEFCSEARINSKQCGEEGKCYVEA
jgi:hypothetical protein